MAMTGMGPPHPQLNPPSHPPLTPSIPTANNPSNQSGSTASAMTGSMGGGPVAGPSQSSHATLGNGGGSSATPNSADACLRIVRELMCHRQGG